MSDNGLSASVSPEIKIAIVGTNDTPVVVSGVDSASLVRYCSSTFC